MPPHTTAVAAADLADELARARLLPADRLSDLLAEFPGGSPAALADFLAGRGALTRFQADRALAGRVRSLVVGPYRLTGPPRRGGLGLTYPADRPGRGPVALVAVPLRSLWRAKQARELARRVAALPPHPAVAPLLDADSANGFHYLVWPASAGELLADRVAAGGPLTPAAAAALLAHLAAGLAACHAVGVFHGLLNPRSVALPGVGAATARVLDLGGGTLFADDFGDRERLFDTLTAATALARAIPFAAPEWLAAPAHPTAAADLFALGAVGYFALTGRPPSPGGDDPAVVPGMTRELAAVLDRLMAPDPAARYAAADEAAAALADAAGATDLANLLCPSSELFEGTNRVDGSKSGSISWGTGLARPPERDDSDASIHFDLPEETLADARNGPPPGAPALTAPKPLQPAALTPLQPPRPPEPPAPVARVRPRVPPAPAPTPPPVAEPEPEADVPVGSPLWKRVRRNVLFWKPPADTVRVHVYGPRATARSESPRVTVCLFPPSATESVTTLARAFEHDAVRLGAGTLAAEVVRGEQLAVHLAVAGVAVTTPLRKLIWQGSPIRVEFDLVVPWEAPTGPAAGVVSVGRDEVRVGKAEFPLVVAGPRG